MNGTTLEDARERLFEKMADKGAKCPCCDRFAKIYKRPLNKTMVAGLRWINSAKKDDDGFVSVAASAPAWLLRTNQHTILKNWGLVEQARNEDPKKSDSGRWKVTDKGKRFLVGWRIRKYALLYNDDCLGLEGPEISISEICNIFDYEELMAA